MTPDEAQQIAEIIRHVGDREEILYRLAAAFPEYDWRDLVLLTCPSCGRRKEYLYNDRWCYDCVPPDWRPDAVKMNEVDRAAREILTQRVVGDMFLTSPLLKFIK